MTLDMMIHDASPYLKLLALSHEELCQTNDERKRRRHDTDKRLLNRYTAPFRTVLRQIEKAPKTA